MDTVTWTKTGTYPRKFVHLRNKDELHVLDDLDETDKHHEPPDGGDDESVSLGKGDGTMSTMTRTTQERDANLVRIDFGGAQLYFTRAEFVRAVARGKRLRRQEQRLARGARLQERQLGQAFNAKAGGV